MIIRLSGMVHTAFVVTEAFIGGAALGFPKFP